MLRIFGLPIASLTPAEAVQQILGFVHEPGEHLVVTANPEILSYARYHPKYYQVLQAAALIVPDGTGIVLSSYFYGQPLKKGRVTGVNLVQEIIKDCAYKGLRVFLVGSTNEVLIKTTLNFAYNYNKKLIIEYCAGPFFHRNSTFPLKSEANDKLISKILEFKPDVLLVAFGHPKQELWLKYYLPQLKVRVGLGVGGAFDYLSGVVPMAPSVLRLVGLEWFWRLILQPSRIKRIITAVVVFPWLVLVEIFSKMFHVEHFGQR